MTKETSVVAVRSSVEAALRTEHKGLSNKIPEGCGKDFSPHLILSQLEFQFKDPKKGKALMECSPHSIAGAVAYCTQTGLEPGYGQGTPDVYLIPYGKELTCQTSYQGELKLAQRAGKFKSVYSAIIYNGDEFRFWNDMNGQNFSHEILQFADRSDENIHSVYAISMTHEGTPSVEIMTKAQLEDLEEKTRKGQNKTPAWKNWFEGMARKTVLRKLAKNLPLTSAQAIAETLDNSQNTIDVDAKELSNNVKQLTSKDVIG